MLLTYNAPGGKEIWAAMSEAERISDEGLSALEFWAKQAPAYLADEEIQSASPFVRGRRMVVRYRPVGLVCPNARCASSCACATAS